MAISDLQVLLKWRLILEHERTLLRIRTSINSIRLFFFIFEIFHRCAITIIILVEAVFFFIVYGTLKNLCKKKVKNFLTSLICRGVHGNYFSFHFVLADSNRHSLQNLWRQTSEVKIRLPACFWSPTSTNSVHFTNICNAVKHFRSVKHSVLRTGVSIHRFLLHCLLIWFSFLYCYRSYILFACYVVYEQYGSFLSVAFVIVLKPFTGVANAAFTVLSVLSIVLRAALNNVLVLLITSIGWSRW